jgi:hypothetical protein
MQNAYTLFDTTDKPYTVPASLAPGIAQAAGSTGGLQIPGTDLLGEPNLLPGATLFLRGNGYRKSNQYQYK